MITKFIKKLLGQSAPSGVVASSLGTRVEVSVKQHGIDPSLVDERALDVVHTLQDAGFEAYIVGGAVRDLLLGLRPKDFDVATDATPEEVKRLFRRAFIIGRRFRIVHVIYGRGREHEVIEVSTFRAHLDSADARQVKGNEKTSRRELADTQHAVDASGRVLRDNVWGPQIEDAVRRDFSINALYFDPSSEVVVDYHDGLRDAKKKLLRLIGDPAARYREDPVRIIRAVRFAAKLAPLGFKLDAATAKPLREMKTLLADVPQSRLFDEMLKLLQTGHAVSSVAQLQKLGLDKGIYPLLDVVVQRSTQAFVQAALADTDRRVGEGKGVSASFLLACVLWQDVRQALAQQDPRTPPVPALHDAIDQVFAARIGDVSGRGKLAGDMREIWSLQARFERRNPRSAFTLAEHLRFRAAFDFLRLRADAGEIAPELANWWEAFSTASDDERQELLQQAKLQDQAPAVKKPAKGKAGDTSNPSEKRATGHSDAEALNTEASASLAPMSPRARRAPRSRNSRPDPRGLQTNAQGDIERDPFADIDAEEAQQQAQSQSRRFVSPELPPDAAFESPNAADKKRRRKRKPAATLSGDSTAAVGGSGAAASTPTQGQLL
jgi:poly(A) polymerase